MVVAAWIVFIGIVGLLVTHIILMIANKKYYRKVKLIFKKWWVIVMTCLLSPVLVYIIVTSLFIMIQGNCYVAYYNPGGTEMIYYNGSQYYRILDEDMEKEIHAYGGDDWSATDTYVTRRPVDYPYVEYWCPKFLRDKIVVPGELEPIYIGVIQWDGRVYYAKEDVMDEL